MTFLEHGVSQEDEAEKQTEATPCRVMSVKPVSLDAALIDLFQFQCTNASQNSSMGKDRGIAEAKWKRRSLEMRWSIN